MQIVDLPVEVVGLVGLLFQLEQKVFDNAPGFPVNIVVSSECHCDSCGPYAVDQLRFTGGWLLFVRLLLLASSQLARGDVPQGIPEDV
jgi:hypothetical protein